MATVMTEISVIMPVYNVETYVTRAINSILNQTFCNFELIIVDDGSTDGTMAICNKFAAEDMRIKVMRKQNEGVAMARQLGLNNACGEYCIHADADDWVEPTMLEDLYNKAKADDADIVIADYYINTVKSQTICKQEPHSLQSKSILLDMFNNKLFGSLWHKLLKTELYKRYDVRFFYGINHCEDLLIWVQLLQHSEIKISYQPKAFYHYCCNDTSITRNFTRSTYDMRLRFYKKLKELLCIPESEQILKKVSFGIFTEGFIYKVLTDAEVKKGLGLYYKQIKELKSLKWRLGFMLLRHGCKKMAHKLIHY